MAFSDAWYIVIAIVIIIIIVIILVVVGNRHNVINVLAQLPTFRIFYPKNETYIGLKSIILTQGQGQGPFDISMDFWNAGVYVGVLADYELGLWKIEEIKSTSFDQPMAANTKMVRIINDVWNLETPNNYGYLQSLPEDLGYGAFFGLQNNAADSARFIYTELEPNVFQLQVDRNGIFLPIVVNHDTNLLVIYPSTDRVPDIFRLVPDLAA